MQSSKITRVMLILNRVLRNAYRIKWPFKRLTVDCLTPRHEARQKLFLPQTQYNVSMNGAESLSISRTCFLWAFNSRHPEAFWPIQAFRIACHVSRYVEKLSICMYLLLRFPAHSTAHLPLHMSGGVAVMATFYKSC